MRGACQQRDEHVVALVGGSTELIVFDRDGRIVARSGGRGRGPEEFTSSELALSPYRGGSILVLDTPTRTVSIFDRRGAFGRRFTVALKSPVPNPIPLRLAQGYPAEDGSVLLTHSARRASGARRRPAYVYRDSLVLLRFDARGGEVSRSLVEDALVAVSQ